MTPRTQAAMEAQALRLFGPQYPGSQPTGDVARARALRLRAAAVIAIVLAVVCLRSVLS
jgi:hypothetical protein